MIRTVLKSISIYLVLNYCPLFWLFLENFLFSHNFFLYLFIIMFTLRYKNHLIKEQFNFNIDLLYKYYIFIIKIPSYFYNQIINIIKQIYLFTLEFKYKHILKTYSIFWGSLFNNYFIIWRPLFKKSSYFGYYRSNRSKWIK